MMLKQLSAYLYCHGRNYKLLLICKGIALHYAVFNAPIITFVQCVHVV